MTNFTPPVRRIERGRYHNYVDADGRRMPGVTTILGGGIPKPKIIDWAARATAEGAVDNWDGLSAMTPTAKLAALLRIRYDTTNTAKNKGTQVHKICAKLAPGDDVPLAIDDPLRPYAENYVKFCDVWDLKPHLIEVTVANYRLGYAGTLDLVADLLMPYGEWVRWLLDIKTGEKGIFPETALQLAGYRFAETYIDENGQEQPFNTYDPETRSYANEIGIEATGAVHITADDAVLIPTVSELSQLRILGYAAKIAEFMDDSDGLVLPAYLHPRLSNARIVWGDE